jgi:hypothetical protein
MVEPMAARAILTRFGGSAAVWTASLLFFQLVLLGGYAWAHYGERWFGKAHRWVHLGLTAVAVLWALLGIGQGSPASAVDASAPQVLLTLAVLVGLPFLALSANASLLQRWYAESKGEEPYFLYAASNLGSMLALLAYPTLVEPFIGLGAQLRAWAVAFFGLAGLLGVCAWVSRNSLKAQPEASASDQNELAPISWAKRRRWLLLSAAPSSLLLGLTTYLTTNIAPVPLLWVVPLALYLLTFIIAFGKRQIAPERLGRWAPLLATPLALALVLESSEPIIPLAIFHLATVFVVTLACHLRLASERPRGDDDASQVTEFFLYVALGGALGGVFNALVAPLLFTTLLEYPLALALGCGLVALPLAKKEVRWQAGPIAGLAVLVLTFACAFGAKASGLAPGTVRTLLTIGLPAIVCFTLSGEAARFGWGLAALFVGASVMQVASDGSILLAERSFFGVHRVIYLSQLHQRRLVHGNTTHGIESMDHLDEPLTYYTRSGPIGKVFQAYPLDHASIGLVGLGVGSLAAYGKPGQTMSFYEIDPVVRKVASDPKWFTFLSDSKAKVNVVPGDGRLSVSKASDGGFGLLVLDAFSSDSIPVHLITREAMALYLTKLAPGGVIAYHISNRYLDLAPVLGAEARDLNVVALECEDSQVEDDELKAGKTASKWLVIGRTKADLLPLARQGDFEQVTPATRAWTDDYSNVLGAFKLHD